MNNITFSPRTEIVESAQVRLSQLRAQLTRLVNLTTDSKEKVRQQKDIISIQRQIENWEAFLSLEVAQQVTDGSQIGAIAELTISTGGMPEVWVSWYEQIPVPEQPMRLIAEPLLPSHLKIGDIIYVRSGLLKVVEQIGEFLGEGKIKTKNGRLLNWDDLDEPVKEERLTMVEDSDNQKSQQDNQSVISVEPSVVDLEPLTPEEEQDLIYLERKVEKAFYEAGKALAQIQSRKLYRQTHQSFEQYCLERFGFSRRHPYRLIEAAQVVDNLEQMCPNWTHFFPTNEAQCRPLTKLNPVEQVEAWRDAVERAGQKVPTAKIVNEVVKKRREIPNYAPNPWRVGEIAQIVVKGNPDLRNRGGQWAIIDEVLEFSCMVKVWDGRMQVSRDNLEELVLPTEHKEAVKEICDRLSRLKSIEELEPAAKGVLRHLGRKTYLTVLEERLLENIESYYFPNPVETREQGEKSN